VGAKTYTDLRIS
jgi:hypothetical protein